MDQQVFVTALDSLLKIQNTCGFITFDSLMDVLEDNEIPLSKTDFLVSELNSLGYRVFDHAPTPDELQKRENSANDSFAADYAQTDYELLYQEILESYPGLKSLINFARETRPAQHGEANYLFSQLNQNPEARDRLFAMSFRSVIRVAYNVSKQCDAELEDLFQVGAIGLLSAIEKYDPASNVAFGSYANLSAYQAISRYNLFRKNGCYFPYHVSEIIKQVEPLVESHICPECGSNNLFCNILKQNIQERFELSDMATDKLLSFFQPYESVEHLIESEDLSSDMLSDNGDFAEDLDNLMHAYQCSEQVSATLSDLREKEREVLLMRNGFYNGVCYTLEECGSRFNVTRERIRQIEAKAYTRIKRSNKLNDIYDN